MATNYNANPTPTANLTGWVKTGGGALSVTSEGARWQPTAGSVDERKIRVALKSSAGTGAFLITGFKLRRNTATSGQPARLWLVGDLTTGYSTYYYLDVVDLPVGQWVTFPKTFSTYRGDATSWYVEIQGDDDGRAMDLTIAGLNVYSENDVPAESAAAVVGNEDAQILVAQEDNTLTASLSRAPGDTAVSKLTWTFGDGSPSVVGAAAGSRDAAGGTKYVRQNPTEHTYASRGRYTVGLTADNYSIAAFENPAAFAGITGSAGMLGTSTKVVTVPWGPFVADFAYESNYLTVTVDASPSVSPSLDPIDTFSWDFGDGSTATGRFAQHTYAQPGSYPITLTIGTTATARSNSVTKPVPVTKPVDPLNYFTVSKQLLAAAFTPSITNGAAYLWDFGDGSTSTLKAPTHTFPTAGAYSVTLTVDTRSTTQTVTVSDAYHALTLTDALRLEVAVPPPTGTIYNRLKNPDGAKGSFGWQTPTAGSTIRGSSTANTPDDKTVPGAKLIYSSSGAGTQTIYSIPAVAAAGQYAGAQFVCPYVDGFYRVTVEALDANGALLGSSSPTGYLAALGTPQRTTAYLLPVGTVAARLKINHYGTTAGATPAAGKILQLRHLMLGIATTAALANAAPYTDSVNWQNILGPTSGIKIARSELQVGTFSAEIRDAQLDPAVAPTIRPGQAVRLRAATVDDLGGTVWESLFEGTANVAHVEYVDKIATAKSTRITLSATDAVTRLAQTPEPRGVSLIRELPELLEGAGVPFEVNGSSGQVPDAQVIAWNDSASVLDQVAVTRDTAGGYAFVNRSGVLIALDPQTVSTTIVGVVDEAAYSGVGATFDTDSCINSVTIKWLRYHPQTVDPDGNQLTPPSSEEITYGPYEDAASIETWGFRPTTFTMQGVENPATISAKGYAIVAANKTPVRRLNSATIPIRYVEDLTRAKALLDLYDLVQLGFSRTGINEAARVTGVTHTISPGKWTVELTFARPTAVAAPQLVPSPPIPIDPIVVVEPPPPVPVIQTGSTSLSSSPASTVTTKAIAFPKQFAEIPTVVATAMTSVPDRVSVGVTDVTVDGFNLQHYRTNTTSTTVAWIAVVDEESA